LEDGAVVFAISEAVELSGRVLVTSARLSHIMGRIRCLGAIYAYINEALPLAEIPDVGCVPSRRIASSLPQARRLRWPS
jgi:hypothetical protein